MASLLQWMQPWFATAFTLWGAPVTWVEIVALVLSLAMVVFNIRVNPWGWPLAVLASLLYFALFWQARLYGEASLQIFFAIVALWGWWQWLRGTQADGSAGPRWPCWRWRGRRQGCS
jgi:nicotinamide mononucleotide transporter